MPSNKQRRETAKRKLERQLERRAARARRRRLLTIGGVSALAVAVVVAIVLVVVLRRDDDTQSTASSDTASSETASSETSSAPAGGNGTLPAFAPPAGLGANCTYPTSGQPAKPVGKPREGAVPREPAQVSASMTTNQGNIGLMLNNDRAPCTVNSFSNLAQAGYFDKTTCHRLTSGELNVLQCGDPKGDGTGGPGYSFANEYPTNQYRPDDPALTQPVTYPRGTLAMAHSREPNSNGSQFFLVYKDSTLPPDYTVFGTIDETGLKTLDKIAGQGIKGGGPDGAPAQPVTIENVRLD
ncbi:peptidylprolyl isomerase [Mycobacterium sp. MYCO198283]|uniref:peptidylprolyl isomerase n=1 Tax=Mycobacterium sp. MYCO198283 TaxID=2883505 RepID=UPI001E5FC92E|nr:peptidylprolyl isomerase [Mycobacterium sp. MYCO198283]MCG5433657.1 peptidylprolyl isomerase [Mycobacterium sp. MYCO198283]